MNPLHYVNYLLTCNTFRQNVRSLPRYRYFDLRCKYHPTSIKQCIQYTPPSSGRISTNDKSGDVITHITDYCNFSNSPEYWGRRGNGATAQLYRFDDDCNSADRQYVPQWQPEEGVERAGTRINLTSFTILDTSRGAVLFSSCCVSVYARLHSFFPSPPPVQSFFHKG